jgi:hypothetical protein
MHDSTEAQFFPVPNNLPGAKSQKVAKSSPTYSPGALRNNQALCNLMQFEQPQLILDTANLQHGSKQPCLMLVGVEPFTFFSFF